MGRIFSEEGYFDFLYDLAFVDDDYVEIAKVLHDTTFEWVLRMDENRMYDGIEIRKYYLSDEHGYLPKDIDVNDYIFPKYPSVFEVLVGFSNRMRRDLSCEMEIFELIEMFLKNTKIFLGNWEVAKNKEKILNSIKKWENGAISIFGLPKGDFEGLDLWSQASLWLYEG